MAKRRILFGVKAAWNQAIAGVVDCARFDCDFLSFDAARGPYDAVVPLTLDQQAQLRRRSRAVRRALPGPRRGDARRSATTRSGSTGCWCARAWARFVPRMRRPRAAVPPFVLKRRKDEFGQSSYVIVDEATLAAVEPLLDDPQFFAQALVQGAEEYVSHVVAVRGEIRHELHIAYLMPGEALIRGQSAPPVRSQVLEAAPAPRACSRRSPPCSAIPASAA